MHLSHSVLIVDDDDDIRDALLVYMAAFGLNVQVASSAEDALRQIGEGFQPCVAIVDLSMPGMDGWHLIARFREDLSLGATGVVILSCDQSDRPRADALGVRQHIVKPAPPDAIVAAVEKHCGLRHL